MTQINQVELKTGAEVTEQKLKEHSTAPCVTNTDIDALMQRVEVHTTTCQEPTPHVMAIAWLDGKFHLGTAISKSDIQTGYFNEELGIKYSTKDVLAIAENKLWELEGYALYAKTNGIDLKQPAIDVNDYILSKKIRQNDANDIFECALKIKDNIEESTIVVGTGETASDAVQSGYKIAAALLSAWVA